MSTTNRKGLVPLADGLELVLHRLQRLLHPASQLFVDHVHHLVTLLLRLAARQLLLAGFQYIADVGFPPSFHDGSARS